MIEAVFFDFGGVIAEEGWVNGLTDIAHHHGFYPPMFFDDACDVLWSTGYMYGRADENTFWQKLGERYDFRMTVDEMRNVIFKKFVIRQDVLDVIRKIREAGFRTAILSDQVNWLDEFNDMYGFFSLFDRVYNSYHLGIGKKDERVFPMVCDDLGVDIENALFVDDNEGHIERAKNCGMNTLLFCDPDEDIIKLKEMLHI
ncbi:MAG: HAD family hydrolase [Deferribacterales bacterium]